MDCRTVLDILTTLGSSGIEHDTGAQAHIERCAGCAKQFKAEQELDALLETELPGVPSSSAAMSRIMATLSSCQVSDSTVLSYIDESLSATERRDYQEHRESCSSCQSREASHLEVWAMLEHGFPAALPYNQEAIDRCQEAVFGSQSAAPRQSRSQSRSRSRNGGLSIGPRPPMTLYFAAAAAFLVAFTLAALFFKQPEQNDVAENTPRVKDVIRDNNSKKKDFAPLRDALKENAPDEVKKTPEKQTPPEDKSKKTDKAPNQTPKMDFAKNDPVKDPVKTSPKDQGSNSMLASLSKEDQELILNLDILEKMDEAENLDLAMDSDLIAAMTIEDFGDN
ncbi:MAG: hypothetical protein P1V97_18035 [Planctomycetota bacterium]|nr:hypothetical protein [Planctomycetota bacterium]